MEITNYVGQLIVHWAGEEFTSRNDIQDRIEAISKARNVPVERLYEALVKDLLTELEKRT